MCNIQLCPSVILRKVVEIDNGYLCEIALKGDGMIEQVDVGVGGDATLPSNDAHIVLIHGIREVLSCIKHL